MTNEKQINKLIRVYLAGPDLFYPDSAARYERLKAICANYGMVGVTPVDNDLGDLTPKSIRQGNIALIRSCDCVLANLAMFRGPEPDSGTVYEVGFAHALGKPVAGYTGDELDTLARVGKFQRLTQGPDGKQWLDQDGAFVEAFGLSVNLMVTGESEVYEHPETAAKLLSELMAESAASA